MSNLKKRLPPLFLVLCGGLAVLLLAPASAAAERYLVWGTVLAIPSAKAADPTLATEDLVGQPLPFAAVAVHDRTNGARLAATSTTDLGAFRVTFETGSTEVELRVAERFGGVENPLPPARAGVNDLDLDPPAIGTVRAVGAVVRVESDAFLEVGRPSDEGPGVGILFTRVGKVEVDYIEQEEGSPVAGLADLSGDLVRAAELGLPNRTDLEDGAGWYRRDVVFQQAPFSGRLMVFGGLGRPSGPGCPDSIDWYQVGITDLDSGHTFLWNDPMHKTRYEAHGDDVTSTLEKFGPTTLRGAGGEVVEALYLARVDDSDPNVTYSYPDLRVNWQTGGDQNGLYRLTARYFHENDAGKVEEITTDCIPKSKAPNGELFLRVDNRDPVVEFRNVYHLRFGTPLVDLNSPANRCDMVTLLPRDEIEVRFAAYHPGGALLFYELEARSNGGHRVDYTGDHFVHHAAGGWQWNGADPSGSATADARAFGTCAYTFHLRVMTRQQNGYHYVSKGWRHPIRAYYVMN